ncbi:MAG: nucleoside-diphosphate kinase [Bacteroidota bacterium]
MTGTYTFSMIKPDAVRSRHIGAIIQTIEQAGFGINALRLLQLSLEEAEEFYAVHKERSFYQQMCQDMTTGPVIAMLLEKGNAVAEFRQLIGATNPAEAAEGTIRKRFGKSIGANAIHGSDADDTAADEVAFFFPEWQSPLT